MATFHLMTSYVYTYIDMLIYKFHIIGIRPTKALSLLLTCFVKSFSLCRESYFIKSVLDLKQMLCKGNWKVVPLSRSPSCRE